MYAEFWGKHLRGNLSTVYCLDAADTNTHKPNHMEERAD